MTSSKIKKSLVDECKEHLLDLKIHLLDKLKYLRIELSNIENNSSNEGDQTTNHITEYHIYIHHRRIRYLLIEVEEALKRIELGTYGLCEETGEPIEEERLRLIPYTRLSVEGAEIREAKRQLMS